MQIKERRCPHILSNLFSVKNKEIKSVLGRIVRHYTMVPWSRTEGNTMLAPCRGEEKSQSLFMVFLVMLVSIDLCCCQSYRAWQPFNWVYIITLYDDNSNSVTICEFSELSFLSLFQSILVHIKKKFTVKEQATLCSWQLHTSSFLMH